MLVQRAIGGGKKKYFRPSSSRKKKSGQTRLAFRKKENISRTSRHLKKENLPGPVLKSTQHVLTILCFLFKIQLQFLRH